jgi:hypothetical protein
VLPEHAIPFWNAEDWVKHRELNLHFWGGPEILEPEQLGIFSLEFLIFNEIDPYNQTLKRFYVMQLFDLRPLVRSNFVYFNSREKKGKRERGTERRKERQKEGKRIGGKDRRKEGKRKS